MAEIRRLHDHDGLGPTAIARRLGIGRASVYRQGDGERIAAQHHQGNEPPDSPLAIGISADEFGDIPNGRGVGLSARDR
jgi:hypothetical protein